MNKFLKIGAAVGGALCILNGLDNRLEITRYTVRSNKLPREFDGFRIAHLSDMHSESMPTLVTAVKSLAPDIIVCTGDMVDDKGPFEHMIDETKRLMNIAPVYMVSGNHDLWRNDFPEYLSETVATGAIFLQNERVKIRRGDASIYISGLSDPFSHDYENIRSNLEYSINLLAEPKGFDILLFHRANLMDIIKDKGFDLILAGHLHGGQMRIPHIGGVFSPKSSFGGKERMLFPKYFGGRYSSGDTEMIVSRGLGNPMIIPRVFNRPELVLVTLKSE